MHLRYSIGHGGGSRHLHQCIYNDPEGDLFLFHLYKLLEISWCWLGKYSYSVNAKKVWSFIPCLSKRCWESEFISTRCKYSAWSSRHSPCWKYIGLNGLSSHWLEYLLGLTYRTSLCQLKHGILIIVMERVRRNSKQWLAWKLFYKRFGHKNISTKAIGNDPKSKWDLEFPSYWRKLSIWINPAVIYAKYKNILVWVAVCLLCSDEFIARKEWDLFSICKISYHFHMWSKNFWVHRELYDDASICWDYFTDIVIHKDAHMSIFKTLSFWNNCADLRWWSGFYF